MLQMQNILAEVWFTSKKIRIWHVFSLCMYLICHVQVHVKANQDPLESTGTFRCFVSVLLCSQESPVTWCVYSHCNAKRGFGKIYLLGENLGVGWFDWNFGVWIRSLKFRLQTVTMWAEKLKYPEFYQVLNIYYDFLFWNPRKGQKNVIIAVLCVDLLKTTMNRCHDMFLFSVHKNTHRNTLADKLPYSGILCRM